jgi:hypothetical protein
MTTWCPRLDASMANVMVGLELCQRRRRKCSPEALALRDSVAVKQRINRLSLAAAAEFG